LNLSVVIPNIEEGQPGLRADDAIVLEDSDDEDAGPALQPNDVVPKAEQSTNVHDGEARPRHPTEESTAAIAELEVTTLSSDCSADSLSIFL
jgi:hypothetical protein